MTHHTISLTRALTLFISFSCTPLVFAANPLPPAQVNELTKLYQTYSNTSQAALASRKQAETLQTDITAQKSRVLGLQGKAQHTETELSELQEIDRKKPGKMKPEELVAARHKHLQAIGEVDNALRKLDKLKSEFTQSNQDFTQKKLATEHSVTAYRARFEALAAEAVTRKANSYKVPQQITESASIACDEHPTLKICREKTQQEAQRRAIEKGAIIVVNSITEIKNLTLQKDEVRSEVNGEISNLKILETKLTDEPATYSMKIQATVTPAIGASLLAEIQRTVKADMSAQVGDGGVAFNVAEIAEIEPGANVGSSSKKNKLEVLIKKAQAGDAQAQYEVGQMFYTGKEIDEDFAKAFEWLDKAARQGNAEAQASLGVMYFNGDFVTKSYKSAFDWWKQSESKGGAHNHIFMMGYMYENGWGVSKDLKRAFEYYKKAEAYGHLGRMYAQGLGVKKNYVKSFEWYKKAADRGDAEGQYELGVQYRYGIGVTKNTKIAFELWTKSAEQGNRDAQYELGSLYLIAYAVNGLGDEYVDLAKSFFYFQKAAEQNHVKAQVMLGAVYESKDQVVSVDMVKSAMWYEKAAELGDVESQLRIANMYAKGEGVEKNLANAANWFTKAAENGNAEAQLKIGWAYQDGDGVEKNPPYAAEWIRKAAAQDDAMAQYALGYLYATGTGLPNNGLKAVEWFEKSASQGNQFGQNSIGRMYANGNGVAKNSSMAYAWLNLAAAQDYEGAKKLRDELPLTDAERAEGERLSASWKPGVILRPRKK